MSDVYLIDIAWRVSVSMIAEGTLFKGKLPSMMDKDTFVLLISCIANNKYAKKMFAVIFKTFILDYRCDAECEAVQELIDQLSLQITAEDLALLTKVTSVVYQRAANFIAVGIAAVLREVPCVFLMYGYQL